MKRSVISVLSLICVSAISSTSAFAASQSKGYNPTPSAPFTPDQLDYLNNQYTPKISNIFFYGLIQAAANVYDTQRSNAPDFTGQHLRLGTIVDGKTVNAQAEFEFYDAIGPVIRQAQINYNAYRKRFGSVNTTTTISVGGIRIGGALSTAPDVANVPSQFSREDGIYLQEKLASEDKYLLTLGFGTFNSLFGNSPDTNLYNGWGGNQGYLTKNANWGLDPNSHNSSLGYVGSVNATYFFDNHRSLTANFYLGSQKNAGTISGIESHEDGTQANVTQTHDVSHMEASVLFNNTNVFGNKGVLSVDGVSFWYEQEEYGHGMFKTPSQVLNSSSVAPETTNTNFASSNATLWGIGLAGDTSPYKAKIFHKGDRITYAAAYTSVDNDITKMDPNTGYASSSVYSGFDRYKVSQLSASVGYALNSFETALNIETSNSDHDIFRDGANSDIDVEYKAYITVGYIF